MLPSYALQWLIVLPLELLSASIILSYWEQTLPRSIFVAIFLVFIIGINSFGIRGYGEAEFTFSIVKIAAIIGFM
jgi:amino acid transporter